MIDFEREFNEFITNGNNSDPVTAIHGIFPSLSDDEIKVFLQLDFMANKYNVLPIKAFLQTYTKYKQHNKNMGFFEKMSFRKTLESYSLAEHLKGVKIASQNMRSEEK